MHSCFSQVVLSHTPYRELAKDLGDKPVVISGRGALEVAQAYGFTQAVTTSQLSAAHPTAVPFCHDPGLPAIGACAIAINAASTQHICYCSQYWQYDAQHAACCCYYLCRTALLLHVVVVSVTV